MSKRIGIDINEVLRAQWLQFDRFYAQEFGEEGIPEGDPYVWDFFKNYKFEDVVEKSKELREPEEMPDNINPLDYQLDENGETPADIFLFKKEKEEKLTAKQVYNRFMYEDYLFEIHGTATPMYRGMDLDVNNFLEKYQNNVDFIVMGVENKFSIPPTLFFLSKITSRFRKYEFFDKNVDMWNDIDVLITSDPELIALGAPWGKKIIKVLRPYNKHIQTKFLEILQINDLNGNEKFEKLIKYKKEKQ
ncbi:MAG: hypothetical protein ACOC2U_01185 [bacterium]